MIVGKYADRRRHDLGAHQNLVIQAGFHGLRVRKSRVRRIDTNKDKLEAFDDRNPPTDASLVTRGHVVNECS